jgi:hypothetical protein
MKRFKIIDGGNLTRSIRISFYAIGTGLGYMSLEYWHSTLVFAVGLFLAAIAGYSSRAAMLKIKPFDNSYHKAWKSYKEKGDTETDRIN